MDASQSRMARMLIVSWRSWGMPPMVECRQQQSQRILQLQPQQQQLFQAQLQLQSAPTQRPMGRRTFQNMSRSHSGKCRRPKQKKKEKRNTKFTGTSRKEISFCHIAFGFLICFIYLKINIFFLIQTNPHLYIYNI